MNRNSGRNRRVRNTVTTKSGNTIKINRSMGDRLKARKASRADSKAAYLATLPKERWKRWLHRLNPKHQAEYWFSREGGIMALKIIGICIVLGFFLTIGMFAYFRKDLPKIKDLSGDNLGGSITYYDKTGQTVLWQDYDAVKRIPVTSDNINNYMKEATVAIEDKGFYKEGAFDVRGIIRAAYNDAKGGGGVQGGSTITQQLVKLNEGWTDNRTVTRKVKELILAVELEREYSKNDILTGYLNIAPYGGVEYGVESASRDYFQTDAKNLSLPQAAMLAAIPQSPSYYSPYSSTQFNPDAGNTFSKSALLERQHYILDQMAKQGYITQDQANQAKQFDVLATVHSQQSLYNGIKAPYFVLAAKQELEQKYGSALVARGGWNVTTTLDMNLQNQAEQIVANNLSNVEHRTAGLADEEATVLENVPTGQISALVGGVDFTNADHGKINYADSSLIAPGSSFKPYDYVTLINNNNNVGAGSVLYDNDGPLPGYPCTVKGTSSKNAGNCLSDYDFLQPGPITLRYALGGSRNIPAEKAMMEALPGDSAKDNYQKSDQKVIDTASAMMDNTYLQAKHQNTYNCYQPGVDINSATTNDQVPCYNSSAIGDGAFLHLDDHVNGLATMAREGQAIPRTFILKVTDAANKTIYQWKQPKPSQPVKQDAAYIVDNMASDPNASYLPGSCSATTCSKLSGGGYKFQRDNGWDFAVKTGTTNSGFDGLMASWSTQYAVVSWVGNHTRNVDITSRTGTSMEYLTEPLTRGMMEAAHTNLKPVAWEVPKDIKTAPAYVVRNHIHYGDIEPSPTNDLYPSWYVGGSTTSKNTSATIDRVSNKIATSCTPAAAKENVYNANTANWNIDIFKSGKANIGTTSTGSAATSGGSAATDDVHNCNDSPPSVTLTAPSTCTTSCTVTATVTQGTHPLNDAQYPAYPGTVKFTLNGQTIHTSYVSDSPSTVSFTYNPDSTGSGTLTATVTDSVLYSGTANQPFTYSTAPAGLAGLSAKTSNGSVTYNWTGGNPSYVVFRNDNHLQLCATSSTTCTSGTAVAPVGTAVTVEDSSGSESNAAVQ